MAGADDRTDEVVEEGAKSLSPEVVDRIRSFDGDDGGFCGVYADYHCNVIVQRGEGMTTVSFKDLSVGTECGISFLDTDLVPRFINGVDAETGEIAPAGLVPMLCILFDPDTGFKPYEKLSTEAEAANVDAVAPETLAVVHSAGIADSTGEVLDEAEDVYENPDRLSREVIERIKSFIGTNDVFGVFGDKRYRLSVIEGTARSNTDIQVILIPSELNGSRGGYATVSAERDAFLVNPVGGSVDVIGYSDMGLETDSDISRFIEGFFNPETGFKTPDEINDMTQAAEAAGNSGEVLEEVEDVDEEKPLVLRPEVVETILSLVAEEKTSKPGHYGYYRCDGVVHACNLEVQIVAGHCTVVFNDIDNGDYMAFSFFYGNESRPSVPSLVTQIDKKTGNSSSAAITDLVHRIFDPKTGLKVSGSRFDVLRKAHREPTGVPTVRNADDPTERLDGTLKEV